VPSQSKRTARAGNSAIFTASESYQTAMKEKTHAESGLRAEDVCRV
jgi:hypothetical protein